MDRRTGLHGLLALVALAGIGSAAAAERATRPAAPATAFGGEGHFTEEGGAAIYTHICAGCHMADGRGATGAGTYPSLVGDARLASGGYPVMLVLHGRKAMPPFADYLTDRQVADVVNFVRTHFANRYGDPVTEAEIHAAR